MQSMMRNSASRRSRCETCLTLAPLAWLKLAFFCHLGDTEIGGFGISAEKNLLYMEDFVTLKQEVSEITVKFRDDAVADHFDACLDCGITPARCGRLWVHTHPFDSALPSSTDEETFARSFGACDWAIMLILARGSQTYCRLAFAAGPKAQMEIPVRVDWSAWPDCLGKGKFSMDACYAQWRQEFDANIQFSPPLPHSDAMDQSDGNLVELPWLDDPWLREPPDHPFFEESMFNEHTDYAYFR
jgi:hypothetical protein